MIVAQRLAKVARVEMVVVFLPFLCTKVRISVASLVAGMRGKMVKVVKVRLLSHSQGLLLL